MPRWVVGLIAIDVGLTLLYLLDFVLGRPFAPISRFIDLDGERNLPTWWSSIQWFCVAAAFWVFAIRNVERRPSRSWLLLIPAAVFLAFSLDEVATIHEYVGYLSDALLPLGERVTSVVPKTGLFFILFGVPFAILFAGLLTAILPFLTAVPRARNRLLAGTALMLIAAIGIEALSNLLTPGSPAATLEIAVEEMGEMIGSTFVLWGSVGLAEGLG
jgi:hypothetical protein